MTTETTREISFRIKRYRFFDDVRCKVCVGELISINEAAKRGGKTWREIVQLIETDKIHSTETTNGAIYVCAASISKNEN